MFEAPTFLPAFNVNIAVTPEGALQDRILLDMQKWSISGTLDQFNAFAAAMAGKLEWSDGEEHRLFNRVGGNGSTFARWDIAGGKAKSGFRTLTGRPLFSGRIRAKLEDRYLLQDVAAGRWMLTAELALNPTRWLRSQKTSGIDPIEHPIRMFANEQALILENEVPLVHGSNVLFGRRIRAMAHHTLWPRQLDRYYNGVIATLDEAFGICADISGVTLIPTTPFLTIKEIETYWEFASASPIEDMRAIEQPFRSLSAKSFVRWNAVEKSARAKLPLMQTGHEDNAPVIRLKLVAGTELRIYAKTTKRLRFEVLRKSKETRGDRYTGTDLREFYRWINVASVEAAGRLNAFFESWRANTISGQQYPLTRLINQIYASVDVSLAQHVLSQLATQGSLVRVQGSPLSLQIDILVHEGFLVRAGQTGREHVYRPSAKYGAAVLALQHATAFGTT